jgi:hypothetical protein
MWNLLSEYLLTWGLSPPVTFRVNIVQVKLPFPSRITHTYGGSYPFVRYMITCLCTLTQLELNSMLHLASVWSISLTIVTYENKNQSSGIIFVRLESECKYNSLHGGEIDFSRCEQAVEAQSPPVCKCNTPLVRDYASRDRCRWRWLHQTHDRRSVCLGRLT